MIVIPLLIMILIFTYFLMNKIKEKFRFARVTGSTYGEYIKPQECTPENNCFKGAYLRSQVYQNVCEPGYGLLKQKIPLRCKCAKKL